MTINAKRILITGAAGGLGQPLVEQLAARGARLVLVDRNQVALDSLVARLRQANAVAYDVVSTLDNAQEIERVVQQAIHYLGGIDVLINAAGLLDFTYFSQQSPERIEQIMYVNTVVPMLLSRALLPALMAQGHGHIVNVGSIFGSIGFPHYAAYSASKFALRGFSQALRRELFDQAIKVTYVAPRAIKTPINNAVSAQMMQATNTTMDDPAEVAAQIIQAIERGKKEHYIGQPESLFAWLNGVLPALVSQGLKKPTQIARQFLK